MDGRPKFAGPIWLEEIQRNKIFNRQKSLLSEDRLADLASAIPNEGDRDADNGPESGSLNVSRSHHPDRGSLQRSPVHMDRILETREDLPRLSRNTSPCLDISTPDQLQNASPTPLVSNQNASVNITNDDILYNTPNEYAV